jgi:hypothetical protein
MLRGADRRLIHLCCKIDAARKKREDANVDALSA